MMEEKVLAYLDAHKEELFNLLSELLKIDTQNFTSYGFEEAGQKYFVDFCHAHGFETDWYCPDDVPGLVEHPGYLEGRGTDCRPNVTAFFPGKTGKQKITLAAHMDTMPLGREEDWTVPALGGVIKDNKIFGRGSSDDKYGIAASIFAAMAIRDCGITLDDDVYITSYVDEEMGGGNGALASALKYPSDVYINLDGGSMEVWPYAVGGRCGKATLHKEETVSSASSVFQGLKLVVEAFDAFGEKRFEELRNSDIFRGTDIEADAYRLTGASSGIGGINLNRAEMSFSFYTLLPQEKIEKEIEELSEYLNTELAKMGLVFDGIQNVSRFFHPIHPDSIPEDALLFGSLLEKTKGSPVKYAGGCLSDLSVLYQYGGGVAFNTGLFKGFGDYGGPHQPDEYVDCDEFLAITKALALYLLKKSYKGE